MPHPVANTFRQVTQLIVEDPHRTGNCLRFAAGEEVLYTGDIHGNRANLTKILRYADLGSHPRRRLVLQELIHDGPGDQAGGDRSFELLLRAARLKISYPQRVHFLLGNHDLAQFTGNEITKNGAGLCKAFDEALERSFGEAAEEVRQAVCDAFRALPLAGRCEGGTFLSHSLPSPGRMALVDWEILDRPYRQEDFPRGGSVYEFVWGRGHTPEQLEELARRLQARFFLMGHQPVRGGYQIVPDRAAIIASESSHGTVLAFDAGEELSAEIVSERVRPIVAL